MTEPTEDKTNSILRTMRKEHEPTLEDLRDQLVEAKQRHLADVQDSRRDLAELRRELEMLEAEQVGILAEARKERDEARAEQVALRKRGEALVGMSGPQPLANVLEKLADAACILLDRHNHDNQGHEGIRIAEQKAREYAPHARALLSEDWVQRRPCLPGCATAKPFGPPGPAGCDCGAMEP